MSYAEAAEFDAWRRAKVPSAPMEPHPDAAQLISIADLMQQIADTALVPGFGPAMLANVGHYLRGLSDRVKALPVARTGPLRVAAEAVSAPVEAVPQACGHPRWLALQSVESDTVLCELCEMRQQRDDAVLMEQELQETVKQLSRALAEAVDGPTHMGEPVLPYRSKHGECAACEERFRALQARLAEEKTALATTSPQAEPSLAQQLQNAREDFATMKALTESGAAELAQANAMCESLAASVQDLANAKAAVDEAHAIELADEKSVVDVLRSELQDRLQKQRAAEAELEEVRKDAARLDYVLEEVSMRALGDAGILDDTRPAIDAAIAAASEAPKP
jgi:hypothetical protein